MRPDKLRALLEETEYDKAKTEFLVKGFTFGFKLGYEGPEDRQTYARNHRLRAGNQTVLWNKIMKEVAAGRMTGPHHRPPYQSFIQSPITLISKKGSLSDDPNENTHLIIDLSWPHGDSLNDHTPRSVKTVEYPSFDKSIRMCLKEGRGCYLSRTDCKSAFLMLPLAPDQYRWLVIMCEHPSTGVRYYFSLKTVCFGSGTSCYLYMKLSNALAYIFRKKSEGGDINNFLDDFLTGKADKEGCNKYLRIFMEICRTIGLPLAEDKTCFATQVIIFLGLLINTVSQTVSIPQDKLERGRRELNLILRAKKITVHQLQRLTGSLNFFCRAVVPGRAFTRRLYAKAAGLLSYHHIRVDQEMRADCRVWYEFLLMDQAVCRPFLDFSSVLHADQINFFTDGALNSRRIGVGGLYTRSWFTGEIPTDDYDEIRDRINIQIIELYSMLLGIYLWIDRLRNRRVVLFCDNESVVHMINKSTSSCGVCMVMLRLITLWSMKFNVRIFASHVRSEDNDCADLLSRRKIPEFLELMRGMVDNEPEDLPIELWPLPREWFQV